MKTKVNFTSKSVAEFKKFVNLEHKSLSSCLRTIKENWAKSELQKVAKKDGLNYKDLNPAYIVEHLKGDDRYCREGVLGRLVKVEGQEQKEFKAWETWTPGRVLDYLRRASNAHCKSLGI